MGHYISDPFTNQPYGKEKQRMKNSKMGCPIYLQNPQPIILNTPRRANPNLFSSLDTKHKSQKANIVASSTNTITQTQVSKTDSYNVKFQTLGGCKLGISRYPDFEYNAEGGVGTANGTMFANSELSVDFDVGTLFIPPLTSRTTRFLGLPLPPFLKIDIVPQLFRGSIDRASGQVELEFRAKFWFSAGNIYRAPPLLVETVLTTEESKGSIRRGGGRRLDDNGRCRLVGVATVQPINDLFMNAFLSLPTECLADLNATITFSDA